MAPLGMLARGAAVVALALLGGWRLGLLGLVFLVVRRMWSAVTLDPYGEPWERQPGPDAGGVGAHLAWIFVVLGSEVLVWAVLFSFARGA